MPGEKVAHKTDLQSQAWGYDSVVDFFKGHRNTVASVYPSEWVFLGNLLKEGMSLLDIGCALGGFCSVAEEKLKSFEYVGVDASPKMVAEAKRLHPAREFHTATESSMDVLHGRKFDLVLCLGILHLNHNWRKLIECSWNHTGSHLLIDLRETDQETVEDTERSYFLMNFNSNNEAPEASTRLPYNVVNSAEALGAVKSLTPGRSKLYEYGYLHAVGSNTVIPFEEVMMKTYLISKPNAQGAFGRGA